MNRAPTFIEHVIKSLHSWVPGCTQNNYRETGMGWNILLCSGASLAAATSPDCDKPARHCTATISKQKGNDIIPKDFTLHIPVS